MAKNCGLCGLPMKQSVGKTRIVYPLGSSIGIKIKNPDSIPLYHGKCRAEGRRKANKVRKQLIKEGVRV